MESTGNNQPGHDQSSPDNQGGQPTAMLLDGAEKGSPSSGARSGRAILGALAAAALAAVLLFVLLSGDAGNPPTEADEVTALAFLTADGETSSLAEYRGQPLVVNFFASWCAPCRAELPDFERVHVANGDSVTFIGVNHDLDEVTWQSFVAETAITYETVFQPNTEIWSALDAKGMPSTAFISADGEVLKLWTGVLNDDVLQDLIDEHLVEA